MRGWTILFLSASATLLTMVAAVHAVGPLDLRLFERHARADADLVISPGARGFLDSLRTGPQIHRYDDNADRTTILDEVWLGSRSVTFAVAEYDGPPSRDISPGRLRRLEIGSAFLFVRGECGGRVLKPGPCMLRAPDGSLHEVTLSSGEIVWCTVTTCGVTIDERSAP